MLSRTLNVVLVALCAWLAWDNFTRPERYLVGVRVGEEFIFHKPFREGSIRQRETFDDVTVGTILDGVDEPPVRHGPRVDIYVSPYKRWSWQ